MTRTIARQRGAALLIMMALLAMGGAYLLVSALGTASNRTAINREASARALNDAKGALLGWIATQALESAENNPGRLPCPEAAGYFGTSNEGIAAPFCAPQAIGRLPWRTLGLDKPKDASGEPLWYVVSSGWALPSSGPTLTINSNSVGQISVDGRLNAAIALIVSPGPAMNVLAVTGCPARIQQRNALVAPDFRDYLECENATSPADANFVTVGPSTSYNDQVLQVTTADVLPVLEAAIAVRIERDIVPVLKTLYADAAWTASPTNPVYPFAVTFTDPGTSTFLGTSGESQGLLPMFANATDPTRVVWYRSSETYPPSVSQTGGAGTVTGTNCSGTSTASVSCAVTYTGDVRIRVRGAARRVARTMRQLNPAAVPPPLNVPGMSISASFIASSTSGAAYIDVEVNLPYSALATTATASVPIEVLVDHPLTDPGNPTTGWFVRNNWHHLVYYAFAPNFAANQTRYCNPPPDAESCLSVSNVLPVGKQRAILLLTGRPVGIQTRPSASIADYVEDAANRDGNLVFAKAVISKTVNDRVMVVDANP